MSEITTLAKKCMEEKDDNLDAATALLMRRIKQRPKLLNDILEPYCRDLCRASGRQNRSQVWNNQPASVAEDNRDLDIMAAHIRLKGLQNFLLPGKKKLGDSTRNEILEASASYMAQSGTGLQIGHWLKLVGEEIPANSNAKSRMHVRSERLDVLQETAKRAVNQALTTLNRQPALQAAE